MLRHGYDRGLAAGVVASAGTLAALIPPSIMFVLYGVFAEVSIVALLMAGLLPGLLTAAAYTAMIVARCRLDPRLAPALEPCGAPGARRAARRRATAKVWPLLALMAGVIGGLYGGVFTPTEAGACGAALALALALGQRRIGWRGIGESLRDAVLTTAQIFFVAVGAILFTRFLSLAGLGPALAGTVEAWATGPLALIVVMAAVYLLLGMFLDPIGIMLITIPVFVPMASALGLDPVWLGVLVVKFVEIGLLTPPVGFQVYVVRGAAGEALPLGTIFRGCAWFLACEVAVVALLIAFPPISLALPAALL
jgi:tripartite ATP-independent transporter DctM subunit